MDEALISIIRSIPKGKIFDTHFVIQVLRTDYSDLYNSYITKFKESDFLTVPMHGHIGKKISSIMKKYKLIEKMQDDSWSYNIHNKPSECACWKKIKSKE